MFVFYLVNELGQSYYEDTNGVIKKTSTPAPLAYSPDGWQDMGISWERNMQKFGLIRSFTISLTFVGDGAHILEYLYNRKNVDEKVWLLIQKLDLEVTDIDYALVHKFYYKGEVDLSTYRKSRRKISVNIMEGGRSKELKAKEGTAFQLPVSTDPEAIRVRHDGLFIRQTAKFINGSIIDKSAGFTGGYQDLKTLPLDVLSIEGTASGIALTASQLEQIPGSTSAPEYMADSFNYWAINTGPEPVVMNVSGKLKFRCISNVGSVHFFMDIKRSDDVNFSIFNNVNLVTNQVYEQSYDHDITLNQGERLYNFGFFDNAGSGLNIAQIEFLDSDPMLVAFKTRKPPTMVKCYKPFDAFRRLVENVSGSRDYAQSSLLQGSGICLTSGDALRGLAGAVIKISHLTYTSAWMVLKCAGIGVEGDKIVLERRQYFLNDDVIVHLGEAKTEPEISAATDVMFNSIKVGYPDQTYDDVNGRYEMNSEQLYDTPVQRVSKILELLSQVRADPVGAELYRINLEGKDTTDADSDNDPFFLNVDLDNPQVDADGVYYNLKRANYTNVFGFPEYLSLYNIEELTPERIFREWEPYLRSCLRGYESQKIRFADAKKNQDFATFGGPGGDFEECSDKTIGLMAAPFFQPDKITVTAVAPISTAKVLAETPRACFSVSFQGTTLKGWLLKGSIISKTNQEQQFILLSHPDNDLKLLENG
jgi:hypothetical protein